ncbi:MAG: methyltransferase domain-containing protein [bacterium]
MSRAHFLWHFIKNPREVGSVTPSSRWLCRRLVNAAELSRCRCVVEFGPGTACLTREILDRLSPEATLFAFEINEEFCKRLKRDCGHPRLVVVSDSAERVGERLSEHGYEGADYIFSGLPFTTLPTAVREGILRETRNALKPGGKFIAYQYSLYLLKSLRSVFDDVKVGFELRNIPPAFCFVCTKSATKPHRGSNH